MQFKKIWVFIPLILLYGCGDSDSGGSASSFSEGNGDPVLNTIEVEDNSTTVSKKLIIPIDGKDITISLKENTREAFTLTATDKTELTYYLTGKDIMDLGIDPKTGFVFFNLPTDYEKKPKYEIYVGVKDKVNNETEQKVIIKVKNTKNEKAPIKPIDVKTSLTEDEDKYFITTWKTDNLGVSNDNQIIIPTVGDGYDYSVDWGDGTSSKNLTLDAKHTYAQAGTYTIKIVGKFPRIYFGQNVDYNYETFENDSRKIISIEQWGTNIWESMAGAFTETTYLEGKASDRPNLSKVTDMSTMFAESAFNQNINNWDISNVENLQMMFFASIFNQNIASWDTSNVKNMSALFMVAKFNQDIANWETSKVENMGGMFFWNSVFNQNISNWDTSSVTDMSVMFSLATAFNQDISQWNTSKVKSMLGMFLGASVFNKDISQWNISTVTDMSQMFQYATSFNQNLERWKVATQTNISDIFTGADAMFKLPSWYSVDDDIKKRRFITIMHNANVRLCNVANINQNIEGNNFGNILEFKENIDETSLITSSKNTNFTCSEYGREDEFVDCITVDIQDFRGNSCVVGFNFE